MSCCDTADCQFVVAQDGDVRSIWRWLLSGKVVERERDAEANHCLVAGCRPVNSRYDAVQTVMGERLQ